jgi:hypothetical protein
MADTVHEGVNLDSVLRHVDACMASWPTIEATIVCRETRELVDIIKKMIGAPIEEADDSAFRKIQEKEED